MSTQDITETSVDDEIMTLSEIAKYLKVSEKTVVRMVKADDLPGGKVSSQWRFQKTAIDNWLTAIIQSADNDKLVQVLGTKKPLIPIPKLISHDCIIMDLEPGSKRKILTLLTRPLLMTSLVTDPAKFLLSVLDREEMVSTALYDGVAIPHVRNQEKSGVKKTSIVLGICKEGTDFDALDGQKTYLFFLLCAPDAAAHLRLLAKLTVMLRQPRVVERFRACATKDEVSEVLMDAHYNLSALL